jgi:tRNA (guanine37-N1)-methyltransferase
MIIPTAEARDGDEAGTSGIGHRRYSRAQSHGKSRIAFTPEQFLREKAAELAQREDLVLVCGRYEGVDERVKSFVDEELPWATYIERSARAMVVIDAVARLIRGLGK